MSQTEIAGIGKATRCEVARYHYPKPLRFVFHHILPEACGGKTEPGNLVQTCDSEHYAIHELLWMLAHGGIPGRLGSRGQRALAARGYAEAVAAGTTGRIPKEA